MVICCMWSIVVDWAKGRAAMPDPRTDIHGLVLVVAVVWTGI